MNVVEEFMTPPNHIGFRAKKMFGAMNGQIKDGAIAYIEKGGGGPVEKHAHPHDHLFMVISGEAKILLGDEVVLLHPNESFRVKGAIPHSIWNNGESELVMIGVTLE